MQIVEKVDNVHLQPESVTFSIPLKTFELHLSRDRKWSSSFDDAHIQYTVEEFLGPSLDTPHSQGKNVTLKLQTVRCSQEMTECAYRFEGSYYYNVGVEQGVDPDEIWIQQLKVMMDPSLLQAAFDKNPYMAVARIRVQSVRFLDGSERGLPGGGEAGKYSNWTDTTHLILMAGCAGVVLVSILGTCAICMSFRNQEKVAEVAVKPPVPPTNSKTSRTSKSTNPTATIVVYHTDAPSVTSSITEQRGKDGLPNYPSYAMPYTLDRSICETLDIER